MILEQLSCNISDLSSNKLGNCGIELIDYMSSVLKLMRTCCQFELRIFLKELTILLLLLSLPFFMPKQFSTRRFCEVKTIANLPRVTRGIQVRLVNSKYNYKSHVKARFRSTERYLTLTAKSSEM